MKDLDRIEDQLARVLGFFPRVDSKIAGLFTVNSALLTIGALNLQTGDLKTWYITVPGVVTLILLGLSYHFLYRANFPDLKGGQGSLIYFSEIQKRTESNYINEYVSATEEEYRRDLLAQIWRNAEILCQKYQSVAYAIRLTLSSLITFSIFLAATAVEHSKIPIVSG